MTSRDFCFWLQGYLEVAEAGRPTTTPTLTPEQLECVRRHLALVFKHEIDPSMGSDDEQKALNKLHRPKGPHDGLIRC